MGVEFTVVAYKEASHTLGKDYFEKTLQAIWDNDMPTVAKKQLTNTMTGMMGRSRDKDFRVTKSSSLEHLKLLKAELAKKTDKPITEKIIKLAESIWFAVFTIHKPVDKYNEQFMYMQIKDDNNVRLAQMYQEMAGPDTKILAIKTDCLVLYKPLKAEANCTEERFGIQGGW